MPPDGHCALADELAAERARLEDIAADLPGLERELDELRQRVAAIEGSPWWQVTAPLRFARRIFHGRRALAVRLGRAVRNRLLQP